MKKILRMELVAALLMLLFMSRNCLAEEIRISCVIPEIPGVNVALIQENTAQANITQAAQPKQEENTQANAMYQKDTQELRLAKGESVEVTVKTVYSR